MPIDPLIANNFLDSCAFDPKYEPESTASVEILDLSERATHFLVKIPHSVQEEIEHPNTPGHVKLRAAWLLYTIPVPLNRDEMELLRDIEMILAGRGRVDRIKQDALHVFETQKYVGYLITTDLGILKQAPELEEKCRGHVTIVKPSEFLELVREQLQARAK